MRRLINLFRESASLTWSKRSLEKLLKRFLGWDWAGGQNPWMWEPMDVRGRTLGCEDPWLSLWGCFGCYHFPLDALVCFGWMWDLDALLSIFGQQKMLCWLRAARPSALSLEPEISKAGSQQELKLSVGFAGASACALLSEVLWLCSPWGTACLHISCSQE